MPDIASRINNVTYISPGSIGPTLASGSGITTVIYGTGGDYLLAPLNVLPENAQIHFDTCKHGDVDCAFRENQEILARRSGNPCSKPDVFNRSVPPPTSGTHYDPFFWLNMALLPPKPPVPVREM
jgi:hypothetical protein